MAKLARLLAGGEKQIRFGNGEAKGMAKRRERQSEGNDKTERNDKLAGGLLHG